MTTTREPHERYLSDGVTKANPSEVKQVSIQVTGLSSEEEARKVLLAMVKDEFKEAIAANQVIALQDSENTYRSDVYICCSGNSWTWCTPGGIICWPGGSGCPA